MVPDVGGGPASNIDANGCHVDSSKLKPGAVCIRGLDAHVVDLDAKPVQGMFVSMCGGVCVPGTTGADGSVHVKGGYYFTAPGFVVAEGKSRYATYVVPITGSGDITISTPVMVPRFPDGGDAFPPAGTAKAVSSGDVTLQVAATTVVTIDPILWETADDKAFRSVTVALDHAPAFLDPSLGVELLYAVGPFETELAPPVGVALPNAKAWPAGTAVDILTHGYLTTEPGYATLAKVATAHVSADGTKISTDAGQGIDRLTWIGVRRAK
jgi:hypothetical protein